MQLFEDIALFDGLIEIVHREYRRPLIFIHEESKPFGFSGFFVTGKIDINYLTISNILIRTVKERGLRWLTVRI